MTHGAGGDGGFTVGFDLDLTLIDSRPGIAATYRALVAETGAPIDPDVVITRLGPPLEDELARWVPAAGIPALATRFRELYAHHGIAGTPALPGAHEALDAVRDAGGRSVVITAKYEPNAVLHLQHLGLRPDVLLGRRWGGGKTEALREHAAVAYVGDHAADMRAARGAGSLAVGVTTGPCDAGELWAAGADHVLTSLVDWPSVLVDLPGRRPPQAGTAAGAHRSG